MIINKGISITVLHRYIRLKLIGTTSFHPGAEWNQEFTWSISSNHIILTELFIEFLPWLQNKTSAHPHTTGRIFQAHIHWWKCPSGIYVVLFRRREEWTNAPVNYAHSELNVLLNAPGDDGCSESHWMKVFNFKSYPGFSIRNCIFLRLESGSEWTATNLKFNGTFRSFVQITPNYWKSIALSVISVNSSYEANDSRINFIRILFAIR